MIETPLRVPAAEGDITGGWLRQALGGFFPGDSFTSLEKRRIGEQYGFASLIIRCLWSSAGKHRSVVVKLWDAAGKAGQAEVLFYRNLRELGARIPFCFYASVDERTHRAVLVLEDLQDAVQGDYLKLLDLDRAAAVARSLARLHAAWLGHPGLAAYPWLPDVTTWRKERAWFHSRKALFLERFDNRLIGLPRKLLEEIDRAAEAANLRLTAAATTLLHGDFHLDNLVFIDQVEPVFLDWSRPVIGPPSLNLVELLTRMTSLENYEAVFTTYLAEFNQASTKPLDRRTLERQLGGALLRSFAISTCGIARWQPSTARGVRTLEAGIALAGRSIDFWYERDPGLFSFLK